MSAAVKASRLFQHEIAQMLFLFGEVATPDESTVRYIEDSIKSEMAALVVAARNLAAFHGSPVITAENLLFLLRKQPAQVQRLKAYLAWREVRRKAFKGDADADGETLIIDELDEESGPPAVVNERLRSSKRIRIETPWDLVSSLVYESEMQTSHDSEEDEENGPADAWTSKMLQEADELTKGMSKAEYKQYSDCRAASFHHKKVPRFREFLNFSAYLDLPPSDEAIECFSFIAYELVRATCQNGLASKAKADRARPPKRPVSPYVSRAGSVTPQKKLKVDPFAAVDNAQEPHAKPIGPFSKPSDVPLITTTSQDGVVTVEKIPDQRVPVALVHAIEGERIAAARRVQRGSFGSMGARTYTSFRARPLAS